MKTYKRSKLLAFLLTAIVGSSVNVSAAPLVSIGDNTDVFFNGSSSLRWTSNLFRDENVEEDDLIWTLSPGFEVNVGRGLSNADFSVITRYDILKYVDNSRLDTGLFHITARGSYRSSKLDLSGSVSFDENQSTTGDTNIVGDLIESDVFRANVNGEYRLSPKFSVGSGFKYHTKEYQTFEAFFSDSHGYSIPVDVFYELTPKVDLSAGYQYGSTSVDDRTTTLNVLIPGYDTERHFFNVGARGNLLPKLTGFFKVGYRLRDTDRPGDDETGILGLDADLTWAATPKLTTRLGLSRGFGIGGEGQTTENTSVDVNASYAINSHFSFAPFVSYTLRDYDNGREDNQVALGGRLNYAPNQHLSFGCGYTFSENDSNAALRSYEDHSISISAALRY